MRLRLIPYSLTLLSFTALSTFADSQVPLDSQLLVNNANAFLSAGQFHDAVKAYSDAIGALHAATNTSALFKFF